MSDNKVSRPVRRWRSHISKLKEIQSYVCPIQKKKVLICAICMKSMEIFNVDHIMPQSLGGSKTALDNKQLTHVSCNARRGNNLISIEETPLGEAS